MSKEERKKLKAKIIQEIEKAKAEIIDIEKRTVPITPENSLGRVTRMDAINNKSVMEAALTNKKATLTKLKVALSKIDDIDFGNCTLCGHPIQPARLIYMPESTKCVRCASR